MAGQIYLTRSENSQLDSGDEPQPSAGFFQGDARGITPFMRVTGAASRFVALMRCEAPEHVHPDVQISVPFFRDGFTANWHTAGGTRRQRVIRAGECCVIPSGQPHRFHWREPAEIVSLYLDAKWLEHAADESGLRGGWHLLEDFRCQDPVLLQLGAALREGYQQTGGPSRLLVEGLAAVAAVRLLRGKATGRALLPARRPEQLSPQALRRALDYIHAHWDESIGLTGIAAAAGYSPFHFARAFKAATGLPPHRYVMRERIERAKRRLRRGNDPVGQICVECGFTDQSHFTRLFRQLTGVTPQRYRRHMAA